MRSYFTVNHDVEEIKHLKKLAKIFDIQSWVDNAIVNKKVAVMLEGDVDDVNKFNKQYQQYLAYRQKLKALEA